jgi:GNAT superfamily N-acetyltransferase
MAPVQPAALTGEGLVATLRDGSLVRLRPIRRTDGELILRGFERLSDESRYRRFLSPVPGLTGAMVRYLTEVDHRDHEAIVAIDEGSGGGVGVARYVRDEQRDDSAEAAVTVIDDWAGRGLGTILLELLAARAGEEGIARFTALVLARNREMMELLEALGPVRVLDREAGTVEVETRLPEGGVSPELRELLRLSARTGAALPLRSRPSS